MARHDESYKNFFKHPEMVADLLRGFVDAPWVNDVDFSTLEKSQKKAKVMVSFSMVNQYFFTQALSRHRVL